jgi:hypothetical protein
LFSGCASFEHNVLKVKSGGSQGNGVILSHDTVLTVKHLIKDPSDVKVWYWRDNRWRRNKGFWKKAEVIREIPTNSYEPLVLLRVLGYKKDPGFFDWRGFEEKDIYKLSVNRIPGKIVTGRGSYLWGEECVIEGDSGSPVVDKSGALVGLISATKKQKNGIDCPVCFISHEKERTVYTAVPTSIKALITRNVLDALGE